MRRIAGSSSLLALLARWDVLFTKQANETLVLFKKQVLDEWDSPFGKCVHLIKWTSA